MLYQQMINLNDAADMVSGIKFINETIPSTEAELDAILKATTVTYDNRDNNDEISLLPRCSCGFLHFRGAEIFTCPKCNSKPQSQIDTLVKSNMWFKKPDGIERLINPVYFHMLQRRFTANGWDAIAYLTDPYYKCSNKVPPWMVQLQAQNFERDWNYFIRNFDKIMSYLFNAKIFKVGKDEFDYLLYLTQTEFDKIFCDVLPLPNPQMFPYEKTNYCIYRSSSASFASMFIQSMVSIDSPIQKLPEKSRKSRLAKMYRNISEYQYHHIKHEVSPKEGDVRRHNLGTKTALSGRAIIISKTGPQDHEEIGIPWFMALSSLRPIFVNKLLRRGYTLNAAVNLLRSHTAYYSEVLSSIMDEMIAEAPDGKIWVLYDRNPSLKHGSMQFGPIYFKKDPGDKCIAFPIANTKSSNADFDGDQINIMFILDQKLVDMFQPFRPWTNVFELTKPFVMSNNTLVSPPQVSSYANFLSYAHARNQFIKEHGACPGSFQESSFLH